jgi:hypothetical protein
MCVHEVFYLPTMQIHKTTAWLVDKKKYGAVVEGY